MNKKVNECCPEFDPKPWNNKTHIWKDKLFLQDDVFQIMHFPVNMGTVVTRMFKKIEATKGALNRKDFLMLCYDPSPWRSEVYMTVEKNIPGGRMKNLSGTFISRVYDGQYNEVPNWIKDMDLYLKSKNMTVKRYYFHYAYCPKCSKKFGHNYCIAFAQIN